MKPLISVIMSVYNDSKNLDSSISSILNQSFRNFELLIMNDGSTENIQNLLSKYEKNSKIKIFKNESNIGLTKSLNLLIKESSGKYIARQDSDDISISNRLDKQINYLNKYNLDLCGTRAIIKGTTRISPNRSYYLPLSVSLKIKNPFIHGSLIYKKSSVNKINFYDENFYFSQDYKLVKDFFNAGYALGILKEPLYVLNIKDNISTKYKEKQKYYADCVKKNQVPNAQFKD
tara:strand:+ start:1004 stop:1699 length:696 start_codon:yes stop_codon:yes gene_type:complete